MDNMTVFIVAALVWLVIVWALVAFNRRRRRSGRSRSGDYEVFGGCGDDVDVGGGDGGGGD